jgi:hypothetical protein
MHAARSTLLLALLLPGCGHRGDPLPPLRKTPPPVEDFRLAQRGDRLELTAVAPRASVDGVVYERVSVEFLHAEGTVDLERVGRRLRVETSPGTRVVKTLPLPAPGTLVRVAARAASGREVGMRGSTLALTAQAPLEAPHDLVADLHADGVVLRWQGPRPLRVAAPAIAETLAPRLPSSALPAVPPRPSPAGPSSPARPTAPGVSPPGEGLPGAAPATPPESKEPPRAGFLVYRRAERGRYDAPLGPEIVERHTQTDGGAPLGATSCYVVRAVASLEPLVESGSSNEACLGVRDVAAPATPTGLAVLPREAGLELLWSPSPEPDLAGYRVLRAEGGGEMKPVAEVDPAQSSWVDETVAKGVSYRYSLLAVDGAGNASPPSLPVSALLP